MSTRHLTIALLTAASTFMSGCTLAHMRAPAAPPETMQATLLTGIGGKESGGFDLAGAHGNFVRSSGAYRENDYPGDRDPVLHKGGDGEFTVWGDGVEGRLAARCGSHSTEIETGAITLSGEPLSYRCRFTRDGRPIDARLEIREPRSAKVLAPREGLLFFRGRRMDIRSVHEFDDPRIARSGTAAGYAFVVDGQEIGGIDLTNAPYRVHLPRDPAYREAAIAASIAMGLFSDPEHMMSEERGPDY